MKHHSLARTLTPLFLGLALGSCSSSSMSNDAGDGADAGMSQRATCTVHLQPGADPASTRTAVQTALSNASSGDVICFDDGTYQFDRALSLATPHITVQGTADGAVLDFAMQTMGDNSFLVTGTNFTIQYLTIKNTQANGVRVEGSDYVTFRHIHALWDRGPSTMNGAYALYPVQSGHVLIEDCEVEGAADAGIYVGQSHDVIVRRNQVHGNVAGIEFENCTNSCGYGNHAYDNTTGFLVFNLPGLMVLGGGHALVHDNVIENNNRANFCHPGGIVCDVPTGLGAMILASDYTEFTANTISGNDNAGMIVVDFRTENPTASLPAMYDPKPENNYIHDNTFTNNGSQPSGLLAAFATDGVGPDLLWDGYGTSGHSCTDNSTAQLCIHEAATLRFACGDAPTFSTQTHDVSVHNCMGAGETCVSF